MRILVLSIALFIFSVSTALAEVFLIGYAVKSNAILEMPYATSKRALLYLAKTKRYHPVIVMDIDKRIDNDYRCIVLGILDSNDNTRLIGFFLDEQLHNKFLEQWRLEQE